VLSAKCAKSQKFCNISGGNPGHVRVGVQYKVTVQKPNVFCGGDGYVLSTTTHQIHTPNSPFPDNDGMIGLLYNIISNFINSPKK